MEKKRFSFKKVDFVSVVIFFYWLVILYYYRIGMSGTMLNGFRLAFSTPAFFLVFFKRKTGREKKLFAKEIILLFVLLTVGWMSSAYNQNSTYLAYGFMILSNAGIALFMRHYRLNERVAVLLFAIFSMLLIGHYAVHGNLIEIFDLDKMSRNYVSVFLLCFLCIIYSADKSEKKYFRLLPFVTLLFCCMAEGRGGILAGLLLSAIYFYLILKDSKKPRKNYFILGAIVVGSLAVLFLLSENGRRLIDFLIGKFAYRGFSSNDSRVTLMYIPYLQKLCSIKNLLFGVNVESVYSGHLHNTYLMMHARFGLTGLLIFLVLFVRALRYSWKSGNKMLGAVIAALMLRIFTDTVFTMTVFDSILFYILFLGLERNEKWEIGDKKN